MRNFFKCLRYQQRFIIIGLACIEFFRILVIPNPLDILVLMGLVLLFFCWCNNNCC